MYNPNISSYDTNPISDICEYYGIDWEEVWWMDWHVAYETTVSRTLENKDGDFISISLYRLPSGRYEAACYNAGNGKRWGKKR